MDSRIRSIVEALVTGLDDYELTMLRTLNQPNDDLVIRIGAGGVSEGQADLSLSNANDLDAALNEIERLLANKHYLIEYYL
ncbi:hypothetical protein ACFL6U_10705 [Planctomycetota bacterium]